jgi:hypothetical protein
MYDIQEGSMETRDFDKFVANQQEKDEEIDWIDIREEWLKNLDSLYQRIVVFLQEYVASGSISHTFSNVELTEEHIGSYSANRMDIKIGRQRVAIVPVGTLLIGSRGRVDIVGSAGRALLLLVDERAKRAADLIKVTVTINEKVRPSSPTQKQPIAWAWKIVTNGPVKKFVDFEKESFLTLLMEIANG